MGVQIGEDGIGGSFKWGVIGLEYTDRLFKALSQSKLEKGGNSNKSNAPT